MEKKTVCFDDGTEVTIVKDNGRYYICEDGIKFHKTNKHVLNAEDGKQRMYVHNVFIPDEEKEEKPATEQMFVQVHEKKSTRSRLLRMTEQGLIKEGI